MKITRIKLTDFMDALKRIHNEGAEYIDIVGVSDNKQDTIMVEVRDEYIRNEGLTDELLNDLL